MMLPRNINKHYISVFFALLGLVCALISATMIVVFFAELHPIIIVEKTIHSSEGIENVVHVEELRLETHLLRGHRRLTEHEIIVESNTITSDKTTHSTHTVLPPNSTRALPLSAVKIPTVAMHASTVVTPVSIPSPTTLPTSFPSAVPTHIEIYDLFPSPGDIDTEKVEPSQGGSSAIATETLPAVMVGLASSIIVCALVLFASDVRDRRRHEKWVTDQRQLQELVDDSSSQKSPCDNHDDTVGESMTSGGSSHTSNEYWVHARMNQLVEYGTSPHGTPTNMLPPMLSEDHRDEFETSLEQMPLEDVSISRVSTLTASLVDGGFSYTDIGEKMTQHAIESSSDVTELSDHHRVNHDTALTSLVRRLAEENDSSVCSSLTNGSTGSSGTAKLRGEECFDGREDQFISTPQISPMASLELSPDSPQFDLAKRRRGFRDESIYRHGREHHSTDHLAQLEQVIGKNPSDQMSSNASSAHDVCESPMNENHCNGPLDVDGSILFVRDVYFIPCTTDGISSLGLELSDATSTEAHATVTMVALSSPLAGRVFEGDAIVSVNDTRTLGLSGTELLQLVEQNKADLQTIRLSVMSSHSDNDNLSDGQQSLDLGVPESFAEI